MQALVACDSLQFSETRAGGRSTDRLTDSHPGLSAGRPPPQQLTVTPRWVCLTPQDTSAGRSLRPGPGSSRTALRLFPERLEAVC